MSWWSRKKYPGDVTDVLVRESAREIVGKGCKAVAIVVIDDDGLAHGNIAMRGVGFVGEEADKLKRQLAARLDEYQNQML